MLDDDQVMTDDTNASSDDTAQPKNEETPVVETPTEENSTEEAPTEEAKAEEAQAPDSQETTGETPVATAAGVDAQGRQLYTTVCSNCGNETQVPFQPAAGRPVFCRDCFIKKQQEGRGGN